MICSPSGVIVTDVALFEHLLTLGLRPVTTDRAMLERLGFEPHRHPKTPRDARRWYRRINYGRNALGEMRIAMQEAILEPVRRRRSRAA